MKFLYAIILLIALFLFWSLLIMLSFNYINEVFNFTEITYLQSMVLWFLINALWNVGTLRRGSTTTAQR